MSKPFNSQIIAKNTLWSVLEYGLGMVLGTVASIAVARIIGKDDLGKANLGSYTYIVYLTTVTVMMGLFGLPGTARKYMAEYLNNGKPEIAKATYIATFQLQVLMAIATTLIGGAVVWLVGDREFFWVSTPLIAAMLPRMVAMIPSQAHNANESSSRNAIPSVVGAAITGVLTLVSLFAGWGFMGLSASVLVGATVECLMKIRSVERWMRPIPRGAVPPDLRRRMMTYSGQEMALMLLYLLVWDRSDVLLLGHLNPDRKQITFFSLPFSLAERALLAPNLFAGALGLTVMAQFGRDPSRLRRMAVDGGRYGLLLGLPLLIGMACVSRPLVLTVYGAGYAPMISTMVIVSVLALPKALMVAPTSLLQSMERQWFLVFWGCACGVVDLGLDFLLDGRYGSIGAALANGVAQTMATVGIWVYAIRVCHLEPRWGEWGRIVAAGALMVAGVLTVMHFLSGVLSLIVGVAVGAALWVVGLRLTAALKQEDVSRLLSISAQFPAAIRPRWKQMLLWLAPTVQPEA